MPAFRHAAAALLAFVCLVPVAGCKSGGPQGGRGNRPVPVNVAPVAKKDMPVDVETVGTVEALSTVSVMPQVGGLIQSVHFKEGQQVKAGDLLFTIDTRPYRASLSAARATMDKNQALADEAARNVARFEKLVKEGVASEQELSQARANQAALQATVNADRANIVSNSINVQFARITAPVSGRAGSLLVNAGNVVRANDTRALVVIRSMSPIYVRFSVPEQYLSQVRDAVKKGKVSVVAKPRGSGKGVSGELTFIENTVDTRTGKIDMKGLFDNLDEALWPGQFVDVTLQIGVQPGAIVVPEAAVQTGQDGSYTYVVGPEKKAELRRVTVERGAGEETVIQKGLAPGEQVVTDGQIRLRDGTPVEIKAAAAPLASAEPAPAPATPSPTRDEPSGEARK
jgi:multidrug efflux system membrane fusion protein